MQLRTTRNNTGGSALIVTLLTTVIIGFVLASYLTLVSHQNRSVMRALAWNHCIPVAEAGIEEALTQVYYNGITNLDSNSWTDLNNGSYFKSRTFDDGSYCDVTIEADDPPVIVATSLAAARQLLGDSSLHTESGRSLLVDLGLRARRGDVFLVFDHDEAGFLERYSSPDPSLAPAGESLVQAQLPMRAGEFADGTTTSGRPRAVPGERLLLVFGS